MLITRSLGLGSLTGREKPEQAQMELKYIGVGVARTTKEKGQGSWRKMDTGLFLRRGEWAQPEPEAEAGERVEYAQDGFPGRQGEGRRGRLQFRGRPGWIGEGAERGYPGPKRGGGLL